MRSKEEAHDYRYFPEPDLLPLRLDPAWIEEIRGTLPELPRPKARRFVAELGLSDYDAKVLVADRRVADFFERAVAAYGKGAKPVANWVINELLRLVKDSPEGIAASKVTPGALAKLIGILDAGKINNASAKVVLEEVHRTGADPDAVVAAKGLAVVSDTGAIDAAVDAVIAANPGEVEKYRGGKKNLIGFFMGQVMKQLGGKGDPKAVTAAIKAKLD
jgi:aspartyl-tRNA(Asn)/glutamyl-tRNA(Gln) amidotransferase subunit B